MYSWARLLQKKMTIQLRQSERTCRISISAFLCLRFAAANLYVLRSILRYQTRGKCLLVYTCTSTMSISSGNFSMKTYEKQCIQNFAQRSVIVHSRFFCECRGVFFGCKAHLVGSGKSIVTTNRILVSKFSIEIL